MPQSTVLSEPDLLQQVAVPSDQKNASDAPQQQKREKIKTRPAESFLSFVQPQDAGLSNSSAPHIDMQALVLTPEFQELKKRLQEIKDFRVARSGKLRSVQQLLNEAIRYREEIYGINVGHEQRGKNQRAVFWQGIPPL